LFPYAEAVLEGYFQGLLFVLLTSLMKSSEISSTNREEIVKGRFPFVLTNAQTLKGDMSLVLSPFQAHDLFQGEARNRKKLGRALSSRSIV